MNQSCTCLAASPPVSPSPLVAGGYSDGTLRLFDLDKVEMVLKLKPHAAAVTALAFSHDGQWLFIAYLLA